ncbi:MAG: hypothetical protein GY778_23550 [bacterium]|nr:hypothetical protein [bacterium]
MSSDTADSSTSAQVLAARDSQANRFASDPLMGNGRMGSRQLRKHCRRDPPGETILKQAMTELGLSARAHDKILRVSRTIADLADVEALTAEHVVEVIHYRRLDRQL